MQVTVQRISPVVMELQVAVPVETVKAEVEKAYVALQKKANIKGFRPGKAPRSVLQKMFAPQIHNDVVNLLVNNTLPKALAEQSVQPINEPSVEPDKLELNAEFSYKARFEVQPEIESVKYEGFELSRPVRELNDQAIDAQIQQLRDRKSTLVAPQSARPAKKGDVVTIDFSVSVEGESGEPTTAAGIQLELGSTQVLPEVGAALDGKNVGDHVDVTVTFPDTHPQAELRGKAGKLSVDLKEVKEKLLPELNDEFAKSASSLQTLAELRDDIRSKLEKSHKEQAEVALAEQIVTKLNEQNPIEVPHSLVVQQANLMLQEFANQAQRSGARFSEDQVKEIQNSALIDSERKVRAGLLMAAIAKKNEFKVNDEDIESGLKELAEETGKNIAKLRVEYRDAQRRNILIGMILEDKILDFIESKSIIKDEAQTAPEAPKG